MVEPISDACFASNAIFGVRGAGEATNVAYLALHAAVVEEPRPARTRVRGEFPERVVGTRSALRTGTSAGSAELMTRLARLGSVVEVPRRTEADMLGLIENPLMAWLAAQAKL